MIRTNPLRLLTAFALVLVSCNQANPSGVMPPEVATPLAPVAAEPESDDAVAATTRVPRTCPDERPSCSLYAVWERIVEHGARDVASESELKSRLAGRFANGVIEDVACSEVLCRVRLRPPGDNPLIANDFAAAMPCSDCQMKFGYFRDARGPEVRAYLSGGDKMLPNADGVVGNSSHRRVPLNSDASP